MVVKSGSVADGISTSDASKTDRGDSDERFFFFLKVLAKC